MEENVDSRLTLDKNCSTLKKQIFFFERRNGMNGKKILLITTLVTTLILISLVALFAKFILDIDFGELGSSEQSDPQQIEQQLSTSTKYHRSMGDTSENVEKV